MSFNVGTAIGYLDLDTSGFKRGFKSALGDLETFNTTAEGASGKLTSMGSALTSVGSSLTTHVTTPLLGIGTAAVAVGNKFESAMSRVGAISAATGDQMEELTDQAMELGASTAFSASEAAAGMENLASAGFTVEEIMEAMPGLLDLAASSGAELATASEIAASAIRGFGLEASSATHVADVFAEAAARTNAQTEDMGEAMKYIAPVANAMGQTLEETAAAIGIMSDAGIKGSQAGTALRGALSRLAKPTEAMIATMEALGLSFYDAQGNMLPLNGIIAELEQNTAGLTQEQRNNALVTLFGQNSLSGMLALMERGSEDLVGLTDAFKNVDGAAASMAETMLDNTAGSLEEMMGAVETLMINIQQVLAPVITQVANGISNLINKFNGMSEEAQKAIVVFAGIVAAIGPVMLVVGKLLTTLGALPTTIAAVKTGLGVLKTALAGISAPVGAIATLGAAFKHLWDTNEEFRNNITSIWESIKEAFSGFADSIVERLNSLGFDFENITEVLSAVWEAFCSLLAPVFEGAFQIIADTLSATLDVLLGVFDFFVALFTGDWEGCWNAIKDIFVAVWDWLVEVFNTTIEMLKGVADTFLGWFGSSWDEAWEAIKQFFTDTWNAIVDFFTTTIDNIVNGVSNFIDNVVEFFANLPETIAYWLGFALGKIASWIVDLGKKALEVGPKFVDNVIKFLSELPDKIWNWLSQALQKVTAWGTNIKNKATETGTNFLNSIVSYLSQLPGKFTTWFNKVISYLNGIPSKMRTIGKNMLNNLWEGLKSVWNNLWSWISSIGNKITNAFNSFKAGASAGASGSYASGLDYVPRDMLVKVHQGESIRTKQQTREDLSPSRNSNNTPRQPLNITMTLDGRVVGQVAVSNINDITDTNGVVPLKI